MHCSIFPYSLLTLCSLTRSLSWPALSPYLNPIENLWDQLSRHVEGHHPATQNLNDLRAVLQEEWNAMPQQTISRLVNSMRCCCQVVIDAQGHMTSVMDTHHCCCFVSINCLR
uniref:Tc1-like transposase DDE domain-containing protein n=1 Tax=Dicentrarchus labrax TaxID=13489 RepID=A0A8C4DZG6_DICLA